MKQLCKVTGYAALALGLAGGIYLWVANYGVLGLALGLAPGLLLAVLFFALAHGLELLEALAIDLKKTRNQLDELAQPQKKEPMSCVRCGTPLPPGGSVCPTCHHENV